MFVCPTSLICVWISSHQTHPNYSEWYCMGKWPRRSHAVLLPISIHAFFPILTSLATCCLPYSVPHLATLHTLHIGLGICVHLQVYTTTLMCTQDITTHSIKIMYLLIHVPWLVLRPSLLNYICVAMCSTSCKSDNSATLPNLSIWHVYTLTGANHMCWQGTYPQVSYLCCI